MPRHGEAADKPARTEGEAMKNPKENKCCQCGRFVGMHYVGYQNDRIAERDGVWCERCLDQTAEKPPRPDKVENMPI